MVKRKTGNTSTRVGHWAFIIGVLLAIVVGLIPQLLTPVVTWILVILGLIIGLLNVTEHETTAFLVATIALLAVGGAGVVANLGLLIRGVLDNIVAIVAPAALIVALRAIYVTAQD